MTKGIFVTGTDTDVGKTFVSSLLVSSLRANGYSAGYFKPVQTGTSSNTPTDLETVASLAGLSPEEQTPSVYSFSPPMAPSQAARLSGQEIRLDPVLQRWNTLAPRTWVVEGAGGLLVPLNSKQTMRELILALEINVVLVASTRLGTINHTLLSLESARMAGICISGLVFIEAKTPELPRTRASEFPKPPRSPQLQLDLPDLKATLRDFTDVPILAEIPWLPEVTNATLKNNYSRYFPSTTLNQIFGPPAG